LPFCVVFRTKLGDNERFEFSLVDVVVPSLLRLEFSDDEIDVDND